MKKILVFGFIISLFLYNNAFAQRTFICPGIKLGYAFGEQGGVVFGLELSVLSVKEKYSYYSPYGGVLNLDFYKDKTLLYLGFQKNWGIWGAGAGPHISYSHDKQFDYGFSVTPYFFGGFIPYVNYTYFYKGEDLFGFGSFIKFTFTLDGKPSLDLRQ